MKAPKFIANEIADAKGGTAVPGWMPLVSIVFFALVLLMLFISVLRGGDNATTATESQQDSVPVAVDIAGNVTPKPTTSPQPTSAPTAATKPSETTQPGITTSIKNNQDGQTYNIDTQGYELAVKAFAAASDPGANAVLPWTGTPLEALTAPNATVTNMNLAALPERTKLIFSATIDSDGTGPETGRIDARTLVFIDGSWKLVGE